MLYSSEQAMVQAHQAVQAMGGAGFLSESPVSRLFRDAKLMEIGAGTSEIRRMLIGRELLKKWMIERVPACKALRPERVPVRAVLPRNTRNWCWPYCSATAVELIPARRQKIISLDPVLVI